jgi:hypothetical protein
MARSSIRLGNTGTSSLVRAAASAQNSMQTLHDMRAEADWKNGFKDEAAYKSWSDYISNRQTHLNSSANTVDQEKAITWMQKGIEAQRSYNTNSVQNETIKIMNGQGTETDKMNLIANQLRSAISSGADPQTVQGLQSLYGTQALKVTNAQTAASNRATSDKVAYEADANKFFSEKMKPIDSQIAQGEALLKSGQISDTNKFAQTLSQLYDTKEGLLNKAISDPNLSPDHQIGWQKSLADLQQKPNYDLLGDSNIRKALVNGVDALKLTTDGYGQMKFSTNPVVGVNVVKDSKGADQRVPQTATNLNSASYDKAYTTLGVPKQITTHGVSGDQTQAVYVDNPANPKYAYYIQHTVDAKGQVHETKTQLAASGDRAVIHDPNDLPLPNAYNNNQPGLGQKIVNTIDQAAPGWGSVLKDGVNAAGKAAQDNIVAPIAKGVTNSPLNPFHATNQGPGISDRLAQFIDNNNNAGAKLGGAIGLSALHPTQIGNIFSNLITHTMFETQQQQQHAAALAAESARQQSDAVQANKSYVAQMNASRVAPTAAAPAGSTIHNTPDTQLFYGNGFAGKNALDAATNGPMTGNAQADVTHLGSYLIGQNPMAGGNAPF